MQIHFQEVIIMNKNTFTTVKLAKGEMNIYDFGGIKLHAYKTNDFIDDEVFVVEKKRKKPLSLSLPASLTISESLRNI